MTDPAHKHEPQCEWHTYCPLCRGVQCVKVVALDKLSRPAIAMCLMCFMRFGVREVLKP